MIWATAKLTDVNRAQSAPPNRLTGSGRAAGAADRPAVSVAMTAP